MLAGGGEDDEAVARWSPDLGDKRKKEEDEEDVVYRVNSLSWNRFSHMCFRVRFPDLTLVVMAVLLICLCPCLTLSPSLSLLLSTQLEDSQRKLIKNFKSHNKEIIDGRI